MMQAFVSELIAFKNSERIIRILKLSIPVFIGIFIFIIPFPYNSAVQEICFYSAVFLVLTLALSKKLDFTFTVPLTFPLILFLIWTVFSLPFALNKENTLNDIYGHLLKHIAIFYLVANFFNERKRFVVLTWILIVSACIFSIGGMIYFYNTIERDLGWRLGLPEVGIGVNYVGFFTITAILFSITHLTTAANLSLKIASIICVFALLVATILTGTSGTFLGLIFPLLLLFSRHKKTVTTFFLIYLVIISFTPVKQILTPDTIINKSKEESRPVIWYIYWNVIQDHSIAGIGYGIQTYKNNIIEESNLRVPLKFRMQVFHAPHNTFIDVTVRLGVVGLALFLYIIFVFGRMSWLLIRHGRDDFIRTWALCLTAIFVSFLIQGMVADMLLGVQVVIFFVLMAMMTVLWRINGDRHDCSLIPLGPPRDDS